MGSAMTDGPGHHRWTMTHRESIPPYPDAHTAPPRHVVSRPVRHPAVRPSGAAEEGVRSAAMALFAIDIGLHAGNLVLQFRDVVPQFINPERIERQFFQPRPLAN